MPVPRMFIVAGPPGAGKSSVFSLADLAHHSFNADDRAADLNNGSYRDIPLHVRCLVNVEFEKFVHNSIEARQSFALETTLRSDITFEQAEMAKARGFYVSMRYVALDSVEKHIERVMARAALGGHAASEATVRRIHASSLANLPKALNPQISGIDYVRVYDNSLDDQRPSLVLVASLGRVTRISNTCPLWLQRTMGWTRNDVETLTTQLHERSRGRGQ